MSWSLIEKVLEEAGRHSTWLGKIWILSLFFFRILILYRIGDTVYRDEENYFRCNIRQPGCENVCFSAYSPFSFMRFSAFQIIVITIPTTVYVLYAAHKVSNNKQLNPTGQQAPILKCKMDKRQIQLQSEGLSKTIVDKAKLKEKSNRISRKMNYMRNSSSHVRNRQVSLPPAYSNLSFSSYNYQKSILNEDADSADSCIYYNDDIITTKTNKTKSKSTFSKNQTKYLKKHASAIDQITLNAKNVKKSLSRAYVIHAIARFLIELIMCTIQLKSFPMNVKPLYKCNQWPCPNPGRRTRPLRTAERPPSFDENRQKHNLH